ncbi:hypothetical protein KAU39_06955 [bacterium]|nr:hypothetical protein [bacterium]
MTKMIFKNYNGHYQLSIQNAEDLKKIQALDENCWVATSIPIDNLNCSPLFTGYVDTDHNGRIRTDELKETQRWLFHFLKNREDMGNDVLKLSNIDTSHPEGQKLRNAAELILHNLNSSNTEEITLHQVQNIQKIMANGINNGDGIIPPEAIDDPEAAQFLKVVIETMGSVMDASDKVGITKNHLDEFFQEAEAYLKWKAQGEIPQGKETTKIMPWGKATIDAYQILTALEEKVEEYFRKCSLLAFDPQAAEKIKLRQEEVNKINSANNVNIESWLKTAPLALPGTDGILDMEGKINPAYKNCLSELKEKVLKPALGKSINQLNQNKWSKVKAIFLSHRKWLENKQGARVEKLGSNKLQSFIDGPYKKQLSQFIAKDKAVAEELAQIHNVEKLILYQKWLLQLANNLVSFSPIYDPDTHSLFEMGTLIIDGRALTFTIKVNDRQKHKDIAKNSYIYLLYVEITRRQDKENKFEIAAAVTTGEAGGLRIGKRGIFLTIDGQEWDAEVTDIIVNPISLWESIKAPFQQLSNFIETQIDKFNKSQYTALESGLGKGISNIGKPAAGGNSSTAMRDLLLGGGIAVAALGSAFAYITKALSQVKIIHIILTIVGITAIIIIPSIIMGFLRLRRRNMSVVLEASGWAINTPMRLTVKLGRIFTRKAFFPKDTYKIRKDIIEDFAQKVGYRSFSFRRVLIILLVSIPLFWLVIRLIIRILY